MKTRNVIQPGTKVKINAGKLDAVIVGVMIRKDSHIYEMSWFNGAESKSGWFYDFEFIVENATEPMKIGFKT